MIQVDQKERLAGRVNTDRVTPIVTREIFFWSVTLSAE